MSYEKDLYKTGIVYWNRNQMQKAQEVFDFVINKINVFDEYEKTKIAEFYIRVEDSDKVLTVLKDMIFSNENINFSVKEYLRILGKEISESDLYYIEKIRVIRHSISLRYQIARIYFEKGERLKSYELLTSILDLVERGVVTEYESSIYIDSILMTIEIEYDLENFVQARFQFKKLVYYCLQGESYRKDDIVYWSIVLNIFDELLSNDEWVDRIKNVESKELRILIHSMIQVYKNSIDANTYSLLKGYKFVDERLSYRAKIICIYIKKCNNDESWKSEILEVDIKRCYMAVILYYEGNKDKEGFDSKTYFDKYYKYHIDIPQIVNIFWNSAQVKEDKLLDDISIQFIGGANEVGGSSVLVRYKDKNILLDAGANMSKGSYYPNFESMNEQGVNVSDVDYMIISHAHLDHTGSAPFIYSQNHQVEIFATQDTKDIMKVMLEDSTRIGDTGRIKASSDGHKKEMFNSQDVKNMISNVNVCSFEREVRLSEDVSIVLYRAGHILGAASVYLKLGRTSVLYTGDYSVTEQYTVGALDLPKDLDVDILITESTYAYHPSNFELSREKQEELLVEEIVKATKEDGVVLIPAFAVGRAQEIVLAIKNHFKDEVFLPFDLYLDGKVVEVCSIYEKSKAMNNNISVYSQGVSTVNDRYRGRNEVSLNRFRGSCIIASSGMLNEGSRSSKYAEVMIEDRKSLIMFSGYLDEESPGRKLLREVTESVVPVFDLEGTIRQVKCGVKTYKLSAHVKKYELLELITKLKPRYTFLVHGEADNKYKYFRNEVHGECIYRDIKEIGKYLRDGQMIKPLNGEVYEVKKLTL